MMIDSFFKEANEPITLKNRITEKYNKTTRKKYFREPKIYQNDYLARLQDKRMITEYLTHTDPIDDEYQVLYLFFIEKNEFFLMLGREIQKEEGESSEQLNTSSELSSIEDSDQNSKDEEDDDSPYFVKITLDSQFLSHLQEPSIVSSHEIDGNYQIMLSNKIFQEIIKREIEMMFGAKEKSVKNEPTEREESPRKSSQTSLKL